MYEYHMVQIPRDFEVKMGKADGAIAEYLQNIIGNHAGNGWEFYRIDNLTVTEKPGCFGALFGQKEIFRAVGVICFRRLKNAS